MYSWAVNPIKLNVSIDSLRRSGAEVTEEAVKAEYIRRGGLVKNTGEPAEESNVSNEPKNKSIEDLTVPELRNLAEESGFDHKPFKIKGELVAALKAHIEASAETVSVNSYDVLKDFDSHKASHKEGDSIDSEALSGYTAEEVAQLINDGVIAPVVAPAAEENQA